MHRHPRTGRTAPATPGEPLSNATGHEVQTAQHDVVVDLRYDTVEVSRSPDLDMSGARPEISVVMPCLDEEQSVGECVRAALKGIARTGLPGEVVVCDNGSSDRSVARAVAAGAWVVHQPQRGYGSAYRKGFEYARGRMLVMGDSDGSYDFAELHALVDRLEQGADYVLGSRFRGTILPGAMPRLHQYVGNPLLTGVLNRFFDLRVSDAHSGMRGFTREAYDRLGLATEGMEFASEIVINAAQAGLRVEEVPITYSPRAGESKLHSFRDGWRHLRFMLLLCPRYLFLLPGMAMMILGATAQLGMLTGTVEVGSASFGVHYTVLAAMLTILGFQSILFGVFTKAYVRMRRHGRPDWLLDRIEQHFSLERGLVTGTVLFATGIAVDLWVLLSWLAADRGELDAVRLVLAAGTLMVVGAQTAFASFFLSLFDERQPYRARATS